MKLNPKNGISNCHPTESVSVSHNTSEERINNDWSQGAVQHNTWDVSNITNNIKNMDMNPFDQDTQSVRPIDLVFGVKDLLCAILVYL